MARHTPQRAAIRAAIERADRPLSPTEILDEARRTVPALGLATVYRAIRALVDERWLRPVGLQGAPDRYEVADKGHHHHFHCRECDRVFEVEGCPGDLVRLAPRGFRVETHEITLFGLCRACSG